ncbi:MAG TPA: long-chain fatty acid--CoA ligase [Desulfomonilaceae bacterium]|nr:long-chain fatty acid--CoA ligase [Desulfomonilaceae bacterium]
MEKIWIKSYAPGVPATVDFKNISLQEALTQTANRFPDNPALVFQGKRISYRELDVMVSTFASALHELGVRAGDTVGLLLPNLVQTVVGMYALFRLGAVAVPNNPLYTDRELEHQLKDSGVTCILCLDTLVPRLTKLKPHTGITKIISCHIRDYLPFPLKQLFPLVKRNLHLNTPPGEGLYEFVQLLKGSKPTSGNYPSKMDDTAVLIYTGGTTGISKGVELTHRNLTANCQQARAWCIDFVDGQEVVLGCLPFFHSYGLTAAMNMSVLYGWSNVLIPKPEAGAILEAVEKYKVTFIPGVPTLFNAMIHHPEAKKFSLTSVKACLSGAAALPLETIRGFQDLAGILISEAYGLTETSPCTHGIPFGGKVKPGCIGLPVPDTDAKLVDVEDPHREITEFGQAGELCLKGPQIMKGYHNKPEETAAVLQDGWLFTGDIATVDEEGYFTIVDRKKDLIISGGYNIYPREVDEVLFAHPKILEACAIGVPDSHFGERVKAFVVLKAGESATEQEIIDYCKERMAKYKAPTYVEFMSDLPKSAIGKILRKELKQADMQR